MGRCCSTSAGAWLNGSCRVLHFAAGWVCRMNTACAALALGAVAIFYVANSNAVESMPEPSVKPVSMWYCDGWDGVRYPTEKSMRSAFK